jgi:dephospho-CoA kinase
MKKIGITGGIGSGKSAVCQIFKTLGIPVYDADARAKFLTENDAEIRKKITENFGEKTFEGGKLNRAYLASLVFREEEKRLLLNSIVHPAVAKDFEKWYREQKNAPYVLKEAALMIEAGSYKDLDALVLITAPENVRLERVRKRDPQRSIEEIRSIMQKQMPEEEKKKYANFVIENEGESSLIRKVLDLHAKFIALDFDKA